jgi:hypothetical protein
VTEQEWLMCNEPNVMLEFLRGKASDQKLRLFACACCRRIWPLITHRRAREIIASVELRAEGLAWGAIEPKPLPHTAYEASPVIAGDMTLYAADSIQHVDAVIAAQSTAVYAGDAAAFAVQDSFSRDFANAKAKWWSVRNAESAAQAVLLRCLIGNPFRSQQEGGHSWGKHVLDVAQQVHDQGTLERLPELANALEAAGCQDAHLLEHLRGAGPHHRRCWALQLVLSAHRS